MDFIGAIREFRIWLSFSGYNRKARAAWDNEGQRIFDTSALEKNLNYQLAELESTSRRMWGAEIELREAEARRLNKGLPQLEADLDLFHRDFHRELEEAYRNLNEIKDEQRSCADELREAHEALNEARSEIRAWHEKSTRTPWLFGNAGRELPRHSIFGQSFGDLDDLKADRASAVYAIRRASDRRADLNSSFQEVLESIRRIKFDRQRMFELRKSGHNKRVLGSRIVEVCKLRDDSHHRADELRMKRTAWEMKERKSSGIEAMQDSLKETRLAHDEYRARFHSKEEHAKRRAQHRAAWMREQQSGVPENDSPSG